MGARKIDPRLTGRDGKIWRAWINGKTMDAIAAEYDISQPTVSRVIALVRRDIPPEDREAIAQREMDFLDHLRVKMMELVDAAAAPVIAGKEAEPVYDPETGALVRDHSGRLAAVDRAIKLHERITKLVGLEAPTRVEQQSTITVQHSYGVDITDV